MAILILRSGKHAGHHLTIPPGTVVTFGREANSTIRIPSEEVSRDHCQLTIDKDGSLQIQDMGSKNGTFVNGEAIFALTILKPHDTFAVGPMQFEVGAPPEAVAPSAGESTIHQLPETDTEVKRPLSQKNTTKNKTSASAKSHKKKQPAKKKKRFQSGGVSEDNIADFLEIDDELPPDNNPGDTTIVSGEELKSEPLSPLSQSLEAAPILAPSNTDTSTNKAKASSDDATVAQAKKIIRRYWAIKRNTEAQQNKRNG